MTELVEFVLARLRRLRQVTSPELPGDRATVPIDKPWLILVVPRRSRYVPRRRGGTVHRRLSRVCPRGSPYVPVVVILGSVPPAAVPHNRAVVVGRRSRTVVAGVDQFLRVAKRGDHFGD